MEAAWEYGLTPDKWRAESVEARYEMMARSRAKNTKAAWESLDRKERRRLVWIWQEARRKERDGTGASRGRSDSQGRG